MSASMGRGSGWSLSWVIGWTLPAPRLPRKPEDDPCDLGSVAVAVVGVVVVPLAEGEQMLHHVAPALTAQDDVMGVQTAGAGEVESEVSRVSLTAPVVTSEHRFTELRVHRPSAGWLALEGGTA